MFVSVCMIINCWNYQKIRVLCLFKSRRLQVMAGTGNLDVLRIARQLRKRHSPDVPYGSHVAVHMAIGLLFLGAGR